MTYLPIYQDIKHTFVSSDSLVHYTITDANDNLLYEGSAYRKPGQEKAFIYVNRIVASNINIRDIAGPSFSWVKGYATFTAVVKEATPEATTSEATPTEATPTEATPSQRIVVTPPEPAYRKTYNFVYNWDYESGAYTSTENMNINYPVTAEVSPNDTIPISYWVGDMAPQIYAKYHFPDGTESTVDLFPVGATIFTNDINTINIQASINRTSLVSSDSVDITVVGEIINTYRTTSCNRYTLYYYNKRGGVDVMPLNGGLTKSEDFDRTIFNVEYENSSNSNIAKKVINNNITTKYTATTRFMTDEQAARFAKHFLSSPAVMMHDNVDNETYSVILDENSAEYKTFKSNGRQFNQYTFSFSLTQTKKVL